MLLILKIVTPIVVLIMLGIIIQLIRIWSSVLMLTKEEPLRIKANKLEVKYLFIKGLY